MMNCKRAKLAIALSVGNDLEDSAEGELQRHLARCPSCRVHRRDLESTLGVLQSNPDEEVTSVQDSLWPSLSARLSSARGARFNGWVPAAALAAACLMMFAIVNEPHEGQPFAEDYTGAATPVNLSAEPFFVTPGPVAPRDVSPQPLGLFQKPDRTRFSDGRLFVPPLLRDDR